MKYNPAFLSETQLRESFVSRHADLESLIRVIRENTGSANQHVLVVGARGMGKTTLVHRMAAEVKSDPELSLLWYPVLYAEESYLADTPGRFWLEALLHIARQTQDSRWQLAYEELKRERDEPRLRERALAAILDFADQQHRRLLIVVENMNMLLEDMIKPSDAWALRHTLQNEPRIMLLATATTASSGVKDADKALFDLFKVHQLKPLTEEECVIFWDASGSPDLPTARARQIQILTGGNPRLLSIIASFGRQLSFSNLMGELLHLVDDHTDYFKATLRDSRLRNVRFISRWQKSGRPRPRRRSANSSTWASAKSAPSYPVWRLVAPLQYPMADLRVRSATNLASGSTTSTGSCGAMGKPPSGFAG